MADKPIRGLGCLDSLFANVRRYRKSGQAKALFEFTAGFPRLAPLNALLVYLQQPGSHMVATAYDWDVKYGRKLRFNAKPLIILWPFGPVNFVYDISDTEPTERASEIPEELLNFFQPAGELKQETWSTLLHNLPYQGIAASWVDLGASAAGYIQAVPGKYYLQMGNTLVKVLYAIELRRKVDLLTNFSTLLHELGHLFCGHLNGRGKDKRFPVREELRKKQREELKTIVEFEAESVAWLVCKRLGLENPSDRYLSMYLKDGDTELPDISLNAIFWAAGKIETLCKQDCPPHKACLFEPGTLDRDYMEWKG